MWIESNSDAAPYTACDTGCLGQSLAGTPEWPTPLPPSYHSFVASGTYDGPDAPAVRDFLEMLFVPVELMHAMQSELSAVQGL